MRNAHTRRDELTNAALKTKLNKLFRDLRRQGMFARQAFQCCQGCGCAATPPEKDYAFYHRQDAERLYDEGGTFIAFGVQPKPRESESRIQKRACIVGSQIADAARAADLVVEWDGSPATRVWVGVRSTNNA
jgi:hypothetical protein